MSACFRFSGRPQKDSSSTAAGSADIIQKLGARGEAKALYFYLTFFRTYLDLFTREELTLEQRVEHAGFVLYTLRAWQHVNEKVSKYERKKSGLEHFFTDQARRPRRLSFGRIGLGLSRENSPRTPLFGSQTRQDIALSVATLVLFVVLLRDEMSTLKDMGLPADMLSSRFLEYIFAYCRSEHRNALTFGAPTRVDHAVVARRSSTVRGSGRRVSRPVSRVDRDRSTAAAIFGESAERRRRGAASPRRRGAAQRAASRPRDGSFASSFRSRDADTTPSRPTPATRRGAARRGGTAVGGGATSRPPRVWSGWPLVVLETAWTCYESSRA